MLNLVTTPLNDDLNDETRRHINASQMQDPETAPDPEFDGLFFDEIEDILNEYAQEERLAYEDWAHANRAWFADHRISHG